MNLRSTSLPRRSVRGRILLVAVLLAALFVVLINPLSFLTAARAAGPAQGSGVFYNDLRGSDPANWITGRLDSLPQEITPSFVYQTIYNGATFDSGLDEVVDDSGNAYILARAYFDRTTNDVMIVKLSPGGAVLFVTYLRGHLNDYGEGIALDGQGGLLVSGWTDSDDFPVVDAAQPVKDNNRSGFLARLSTADGTIVYSSFFGANRSDEFHDLVVNTAGEIFLVGKTDSTDFPVVNPLQPNLNLTYCFCDDAFIVELSADARTILYSTYLGGEFDDQGDSIGLDAAGNIFVAGITYSDSFPTANPIQAQRSGDSDLWAARISPDGAQLDYSTYLGGTYTEYMSRLAVDAAGYVTLAGTTNSGNYPTTPGAYQPVFGGGLCGSPGIDLRNCYDALITRLAPDGSSLVYSTYLGSSNDDGGHGVVIDSAGDAYLVGYSYSTDVPPSEFDILVASLDASGSQLRYSVGVWSAVANDGHGIALGPDGDVYFTGAQNAPSDLYAARLTENGSPPTATPTPTNTSVPPTATPTPPPSGGKLHAGDLDGSGISNSRSWRATVTVLVHDANHNPVANVAVRGAWSNGYSRNARCFTDANGICSLTTGNISLDVSSVTFTVNKLAKSGYTYDSTANHDPDGDSDGTTIVVLRP
jgi:hypothetical protein